MNMEIDILPLVTRFPLCRTELFDEVVNKRVYGDICQVWQFPGHILVSTDGGRKLFTFDTKPLCFQHVFNSKCLNISKLSTPLVDILLLSQGTFALVDAAGHVRLWKFGQDFSWSHSCSLELCSSGLSEVVSVTYLLGCGCLFWCEKQQSSCGSSISSAEYHIYKKQMPSDLNFQSGRYQYPSSVLVKNCPPCDVFEMYNDILFISTHSNAEQVTVHLLFDFNEDQLSLYIGNECIILTAQSTSETLDFQQAVIGGLSVDIKVKPGKGNLGVKSDSSQGQIAVLNHHGQVEFYTCFFDLGRRRISKQSLTLMPMVNSGALDLDSKHWFLHNGHLGLLYSSVFHIFRLNNGQQVCKFESKVLRSAQSVIPSPSQTFLAFVVTQDEIWTIQGVETKGKEMYTAANKLSDDHLLQTDALRLSHLQQLKINSCNHELTLDLEKLKDKWACARNFPHHSQSLIASYLEEYWRLESLSRAVLKSKELVVKTDTNPAHRMIKDLMEIRALSKPDQYAKLLWLSVIYPQELLDCLCQGITINHETVPTGEMKKWQLLLGLEGGDLMVFEFVCRLLYQLQPDKLLNFVKSSESVSEQTIGISAFVRKKQSLIYYKTACECLPESQKSCDDRAAASVKAKLILASECENCTEKALKYLLEHKLWSQAMEIVKQEANNEDKLPTYIHITATALAKGQALSEYVIDLFKIMSTWKSFISFSQVATERSEIRQQQLSTSAKTIFAHSSRDVSLASVKGCLLGLVKTTNHLQ